MEYYRNIIGRIFLKYSFSIDFWYTIPDMYGPYVGYMYGPQMGHTCTTLGSVVYVVRTGIGLGSKLMCNYNCLETFLKTF